MSEEKKAVQVSNKNNPKKILKIIGDVIFAAFMIFIALFAISNITAKNNNGIPNTFGRGYLNVLTDSMTGDNDDSFAPGDLIYVKVTKNGDNSLSVGKIVCFEKDINNDGTNEVVAHRIVEVVVNGDGSVVYYLCGDKAMQLAGGDYKVAAQMNSSNVDWITSDSVLAVYTGKSSGLGKTISWMQSGTGFFIVVVLPTILFLIYELVQFIKTYMEVKNEEQDKKKELTEEEKTLEREELKKQLLAELRAQMQEENKKETQTEESNKEEEDDLKIDSK